MKKKDALIQWRGLGDNLPIIPHMQPIPYKATGSRYGACGIRIDGSPDFIDAVLSRLKDLLAGENSVTRLELARSEVNKDGGIKKFENAATSKGKPAEVCYIRLHMRGHEGSIAAAIFGAPGLSREAIAKNDTAFYSALG